jgi:hypothetical protein
MPDYVVNVALTEEQRKRATAVGLNPDTASVEQIVAKEKATKEQSLPGGPDDASFGGRRRRSVTAKTLRRMLKKAGKKTTGKKAALTRRARKAHLLRKV